MVTSSSTVGTFEAKTHLSALLDRVAKGESITITRHGEAVARLVPVREPGRRASAEELVAKARALRARVKPDTMTIREMIEQGRRY